MAKDPEAEAETNTGEEGREEGEDETELPTHGNR